ncbi:Glycerophosphoryl diester phosphodiesterase family-domain-containing protein [Hypoxylon cercidicola]|nr:Glycerophosphoryl diester phosphodiesterase family-domain-containing protein [Hypoxylon cercidicola]
MAIELGGWKGDRSHIFMNLGHFDMEKEPLILDVDPFRRLVAPIQIPDSSLTLEVSAIDCEAPKQYSVSFPVLEDLSNDPLYFVADDLNVAKLLFKVYCSVLGRDDHSQKGSHIGSAVVSLKDLRQGLGPSLESLERDHTVSLVSSDAFGNSYVGSFTFTFVIAKPFIFQGPPPTPSKVVLKRDDSPLVAGHRGLGQNNAKQERLQLGENTMDSFFAALNLGADILEFDVQVTRDLAPVIYHDFLVSETGIDAPMHAITYEQFMVPSTMQDSTARPPGTSDSLLRTADTTKIRRPRASSEGKPRPDNVDVIARLKSTFNFHQFGFKGNVGGECIHGPFITLQQLLVQIDPSVCLDIELKYPMLFEARDFNMDTSIMELNLYLDTILAVVYRHGGSRPIFFSSFSPELCILLATKQQIYPVLFLTESGYIPTRDIRAISFQEAVRFAKKWNLKGVVIRSQPLVASPMLVGLVKSSGLVCASWGDLNNDTRCAKVLLSWLSLLTISLWPGFVAKWVANLPRIYSSRGQAGCPYYGQGR